MSEELLKEKRGAGLWLTINRPDQLNTLGVALIARLREALVEAEHDASVSVVVITGCGRAFCAGADLKFLNTYSPGSRNEETIKFLKMASDLMDRIEQFPKPVVAAVNGIATGGGMELALACDLVVAAKTARFGDGHANYGLLPGAGASYRLPRKIGINHANYLFFSGATVRADDPRVSAMINAIVEPDDLVSQTTALVVSMSNKSPFTQRQMKALAAEMIYMGGEAAARCELMFNELHLHSHDRNEGIAAFNEKRAPSFRGK